MVRMVANNRDVNFGEVYKYRFGLCYRVAKIRPKMSRHVVEEVVTAMVVWDPQVLSVFVQFAELIVCLKIPLEDRFFKNNIAKEL
jgi:hypothetical protein